MHMHTHMRMHMRMHMHMHMRMRMHMHMHMHAHYNDQVGIQIEEPFSILPLEAFCNSAIAACNEEILGAVHSGVFEHDAFFEHDVDEQ